MTDYGRRIYGLAAIALGVIGLAYADFASVWQPVPKDLPHHALLADCTASLFLVFGISVQTKRGAQSAAIVLAALFSVFAFLWLKRVIGFPAIFGTWLGFAEESAMVLGGIAVFTSQAPAGEQSAAHMALGVRLLFGLCLIAFGLAHFLYPHETEVMVPKWLPPGQRAWALITGACDIAAGLALLSGIRALLAARLVSLMFVVYAVLVWAPRLLAQPHEHQVLCGNAINLALVGAAWAVADSIARFGAQPVTPFGKRRRN